MINVGVQGSVPGTVIGLTPIGQSQPSAPSRPKELPRPTELDLPRALNYYADFSGCGFWRMIWPEHVLDAHQKAVVHGSTCMVLDERFYQNIKSVRVQRQATEHQLKFVQFLRKISEKHGFRLIYEIDDIVFHEDIPDYNKFKAAFVDPKIRYCAQEIMNTCDEITVTNQFMKDYYIEKTGNQNITVIPNYPPKFWLGNFYDEDRIAKIYTKRKKKPRILYAGCGAHFDVDNNVNQRDDFHHVVDTIIKTRKKFQWVFLGAYPLKLTQYIKNGDIEFHPWSRLYEYGQKIHSLRINAMVAPLENNTFNKAKSDLKYVEACAFGVPAVCQDLCTYEQAPYKFNTGDEMIDQLDDILSDKMEYMKICRKSRMYAETRWLENDNNIDKYLELYTTSYQSPDRKLLK
jgi:O-antigen biosynthesis protein